VIRVTVELLPKGDESRKRHIGSIEIANDGTGTALKGNYMVRLAKFGRPEATWKRGAVIGFARQSQGPYDLLLKALVATVGARNKRLVEMLNEEYFAETKQPEILP
jgi:hypothetical protein